MTCLYELPSIQQYDINDLFIGDKINNGSFRNVYYLRYDPSLVLKIEKSNSDEFANVTEWQIWQAVKNTRYAKYFAPCVMISSSGNGLVMKYAEPIKTLPKKMPDILEDVSAHNLGTYEGRVVAIDYGRHNFFKKGLAHATMTKIKPREWQFATVKPK